LGKNYSREDNELRVIHVVPAITEEAAGPSYSVPRLCEALISNGVDVRLAVLNCVNRVINLPYLKVFHLGLGPRKLGVSTKMKKWLKQEVTLRHVDIIHNHSLWMMPNVYAGSVVKNSQCRLVVSPRGTLSEYALKLNALQKKIFWRIFQGPALANASCFHATAECEYEDIRRVGFKQPVCIIPNGIDLPSFEKKHQGNRKQVLFLGRIHPKKGVDILLRSWQMVESRFPDWDLHIVGPDNGGYLDEMQLLAKKLQLNRTIFTGPLFGENKLNAYRSANLFVLPTHSENFGMTVAEALAAGTPAIVSKGAPWEGLRENGAGWWIDVGEEALVTCFEEALSTPHEQLAQMGEAGYEWMKRDFSWQRIGEQFKITYQWLLNGGEAPSWVRFN
jgi:glycosyltransferase involved in cell wall biosynthesis